MILYKEQIVIEKDDPRMKEALQRIMKLEDDHLHELRPRYMPEAVVKIFKDIFPHKE